MGELAGVDKMRRPIGVFDSGVGGLTLLEALNRRLPAQDFIYFGDTARVPYGRKPREMVRGFAREIAHYLAAQGVAGVVVACNTASSAALPELAGELSVPVWGVIDPGVAAAARLSRTRRVGVIATKATIAAASYQRKLEALGLTVWAQACPMLVHLVEEGLGESPEAEILVRHYLAGLPPDVDTLILGCTHYPVLAGAIQREAGNGVKLVSSAEVTAEAVAETLNGGVEGSGQILQVVTGDVTAYRHTARAVWSVAGDAVHLDVTELALPAAEVKV